MIQTAMNAIRVPRFTAGILKIQPCSYLFLERETYLCTSSRQEVQLRLGEDEMLHATKQS